jgi:hypothetical protein
MAAKLIVPSPKERRGERRKTHQPAMIRMKKKMMKKP